jgi:hypothetical protein
MSEISERPDNALRAHARECDECRGAAVPIDELADRLGAGTTEIDVARLSQLTLARVAPELHARAQQVFWRRVARALGIGLVPLPLLLAADLWALGRLYAVAVDWMPFGLAVDFVLTYAISLLALFGSAYAVIPLLLAHQVREPDVQPAG